MLQISFEKNETLSNEIKILPGSQRHGISKCKRIAANFLKKLSLGN